MGCRLNPCGADQISLLLPDLRCATPQVTDSPERGVTVTRLSGATMLSLSSFDFPCRDVFFIWSFSSFYTCRAAVGSMAGFFFCGFYL